MNKQGVFSYIIPPYFTTAEAGKKLRDYIINNSNIYKIVNLSGKIKVFESANIDNILLFLNKQKTNNKILIEEPINNNKVLIANLHRYDSKYSTKELTSEEWHIFKTNNYIEINNDNTTPLGCVATISPGIQTGCDKISEKHILKCSNLKINKGDGIFVISDIERKTLNLTKQEEQYLKPFYKNSDIYKYGYYQQKKEWIIITNKIDDINIYPNLKKHFLKFKPILDLRYRNFTLINAYKEGKWWFLYGFRPFTPFEKEKIVIPYRALTNKFAFSDNSFFASIDVFYLALKNNSIKLKYLLSIMNSNLMLYWFEKNCKKKGATFEFYQKPLSKIPIKNIDKNKQEKFVAIVDKILNITKQEDYLGNIDSQNKVKEYEEQIDIMVYKLYELTYEEVLIIDKDFKLSKEKYNSFTL